MFHAVIKHAKEIDCDRIELHVNKNNPARKFYEGLGAINAAEEEGHVYYRLYDVKNKFKAL